MPTKQLPELAPASSVSDDDLLHIRQGNIDKYATKSMVLSDVNASVTRLKNLYTTTGNSGNYIVTTGLSLSSLTVPMVFFIKANHTSTLECTLQIDSAAAVSLLDDKGNEMSEEAIVTNGVYLVVYNGSSFTCLNANVFATPAEITTGLDNTKAVTPFGLAAAGIGATSGEGVEGAIAIASSAEVIAGVNNTKAVSPAGLVTRTATESRTGLIEIASSAEMITGTDNTRAATPAGITSRLATGAEILTGTDDKKIVTPKAIADAGLTAGTIPVGAIVDYAGLTAPTGWLLTNGAAVSRSTYSTLFAVIGVTFGSGDGSTTFNLPDIRDRVVAGAGLSYSLGHLMGATTASSSGAGGHSHTAAAAGGHTHTTDTAANHQHGTDGAGQHTHTVNSGGSHSHTTGASGTHEHSITTTAGEGEHTHDLGFVTRAEGVWATAQTISATGSAHQHTGTAASTGSHTHTVSTDAGHTHTTVQDGLHNHTTTAGGSHSHGTDSQGTHTHTTDAVSDHGHEVSTIQPTIVMYKIIKF